MADPSLLKVKAEQMRMQNRAAYRAEQHLPNVKWKAFQEQRRHEDLAALRFDEAQRAAKDRVQPPGAARLFLERLKRCLDRRVRERGGTENSVLRASFVEWAGGGELGKAEFARALRSLGMKVADAECEAIFAYYNAREGLAYDALCREVGSGRHFIDHPEDDVLGETPRSARAWSPLVRRFVKKLRLKLAALIRQSGEYERILIRRAFLNWDSDASGKLNARELVGAMQQLGMLLAEHEAAAIVAAFDDGDGELAYEPIVEAVCEGAAPFFSDTPVAHKKRDSAAAPTPEEDVEDEKMLLKLFTARPKDYAPSSVVEDFKLNLRRVLDDAVKVKGGTADSILRDACLFWDSDASGELDVREFRGAMARLGCRLSLDEAKQIVRYYDTNGDNGKFNNDEIHYKDLVDDMARGVADFLAHPSARSSQPPPMTVPDAVRAVLDNIRDGVIAQLSRVKGLVPDAKDLLLGTCLRVDRDARGKLPSRDFAKILRELRVPVNDLDDLVCWYDQDGSKRLPYRKVVDDAFAPRTSGDQRKLLKPTQSLPNLKISTPCDTARVKIARIAAEKATIQRRLLELQRQQQLVEHS